jgi:hypothetical protein
MVPAKGQCSRISENLSRGTLTAKPGPKVPNKREFATSAMLTGGVGMRWHDISS